MSPMCHKTEKIIKEIQFLELRNTSGLKSSQDWINSRFEQAEESINKFEYGQCRLSTLKNGKKKRKYEEIK